MTILTIDTGDDLHVLTASRNMLSELISRRNAPPATGYKAFTPDPDNGPRDDDGPRGESDVATADEDAYEGAVKHLIEEDTPTPPGVRRGAVTANVTGRTDVDTKGVAFDPEYCGKAEIPFYADRKYKGQWKKRKGVPQASYDGWYAAALEGVPQAAAVEADTLTTGVDTQAAFAPDVPPSANLVPTTIGEFMGWVSRLQAEGALTEPDVAKAYLDLKLNVVDLIPSGAVDPAAVLHNLHNMHTVLSAVAGV